MSTSDPQENEAHVPQRQVAPRPVRADAEDGPWSVSVADNNDGRSYTIYVKTPTHHLTLSRTTNEISDLHIKLSDAHPQTPLPKFPFNHPPKRKSTFLNTLSRLASSKPSAPVSPNPESGPDPFAADTQPEPASGPTASTSLAAYLTNLSNHHVFRATRQWKRFVRVRTDDLESIRVERAIKRARSDMAVHATATAHSISDASTTASGAKVLTEEDEDGFLKEHTFLAAHLNGSLEMLDLPVTTAAAVPLPEPTGDEADPSSNRSNGIDSEPANAEPSKPEASIWKVEESVPTPVLAEDELPAAARIPRSVSADPDKAARLSRLYQKPTAPDTPDVQTETEAEDSEHGGAMTDGGVVRRKKRKVRKAKLERQSKKVVVEDFEMMRVLGKGCAGKVLLVRHKASESLYALKAITKRHVLAHQELQHTLTEQAVLKRMAHESRDPFVVKLWWSFHDKDNLFLVMDFHPGGDLATQLARWGRLGRDRARFYAAEIVEGVEGLHAAGVIYRDLKPENILIGGDGHIVLTDFGLSKEFARRGLSKDKPSGGSTDDFYSSTPGTPTAIAPHWMDPSDPAWPVQTANDTTTTFCGTAEYLAPEVIQGLPYSYPVDWWSFGTMLYEMLTGITPFWANNHSDMYVRVLQDELTFPEDKALDQDTKSLIRGLLQRNPALRMSEPRIKRHPYFSMIDWAHVYHKRYIPPYIPPIDPSNASDTQNFDDAFLDMDPIIDNEPDVDEQTESDRGGNTDSERTDGPESATPSDVGQSRTPSQRPVLDDSVDVFDGYSFKGRHSVVLDDEDEEDEGYDGVDEDDGVSSIISKEIPDTDSVDEQAPRTPVQRPPPLPTEQPVVEPDVGPPVAKETTPEPTVKDDVREETPTPEPAPKPTLVTEHIKEASDATTTDSAIAITPTSGTASTAPTTEDAASTVLDEPPTAPASPAKPTSSKLSKAKVKSSSPPTAAPVTPPSRTQPRSRREKSGVPALDKKFKDVTEDEGTATEKEDDDWDFVETPGAEEVNGRQGTSLFARGVVDRYRLAFRKSSGQAIRVGSGTRAPSSTRMDQVSPSPTPSEKVRRNRGTAGLSLRKSTNKFLRGKSPPATFSGASRSNPGMTQSASASLSISSTGLLTPSSSAPVGLSNASSLKSKVSTTSMSPGSSEDTSVNGEPSLRTVAIASAAAEMPSPSKVNGNSQSLTSRRPARASSTDDHDRRSNSRNLKKMRNGAEKVFSLFSSPRQQ